MHGSSEIQAILKRILANDSHRFVPRDSPVIHEPRNSWSGARFVRWRADAGPMVLKIWPPDGPDVATQHRRHLALKPLVDFTPELALPVPDSNGHTLRILPDGRCAELFRWLEGEPAGPDPPDETIRQAMTMLARLHQLWSARFGQRQYHSDAVRRRILQLRDLRSGGLETAANVVRRDRSIDATIRGKLLSILDFAERILPIAIRSLDPLERLRLPIQIVLRDVRPNHFVTKGENVVGLVDFGAIGFDAVALDLARISGEWYGLELRKRELAFRTYETIRPLEPAELATIDPSITSAAVLGGVAWVDIVCRKNLAAGRGAELTKALEHAECRLKDQSARHLS